MVSAVISVVLFTVGVFGFAFVVGHSKISLRPRVWLAAEGNDFSKLHVARNVLLALIECPPCLGFWCGLGSVVLGVAPEAFGHGLWAAVFCAFYCCGANLLLARFTNLDDSAPALESEGDQK